VFRLIRDQRIDVTCVKASLLPFCKFNINSPAVIPTLVMGV